MKMRISWEFKMIGGGWTECIDDYTFDNGALSVDSFVGGVRRLMECQLVGTVRNLRVGTATVTP
jgi:hypothetical protein